MSFGWSAGDILKAIGLIVKIIKALDNTDGAAGDYREALEFLLALKRTLEPLQTFTALGASPAYGDEIRKCVLKIKEPIEACLVIAKDFEASLGKKSKRGRHRNIGKKLQWRFHVSKDVAGLRKRIEGHMIVLESLLNRLTLEMVYNIHGNLKGDLQKAFTDILDPRLLTLLQEQLHPLQTELNANHQSQAQELGAIISKVEAQNILLQPLNGELRMCQQISSRQFGTVLSRIREQDLNFAAAVETIKIHIATSTRTIHGSLPSHNPFFSSGVSAASAATGDLEESLNALKRASWHKPAVRESFEELYYLVFLALGHFLRSLFLRMSTLLRPVPGLTPVLIAKYHISFYDALGRAPRILDYDIFVNYHVFKSFLEQSFVDRPGASWVQKGLFQLANARNGKAITSESWSKMISPGSEVNIGMLIDSVIGEKTNDNDRNCPLPECTGMLEAGSAANLKKCSVCEREIEVLTSGDTVEIQTESKDVGISVVINTDTTADIGALEIADAIIEGDEEIPEYEPEQEAVNVIACDIEHFKRVSYHSLMSLKNSRKLSDCPISFLFTVNELPLNEDPDQGGVAPRVSVNGRWVPPMLSAGVWPPTAGHMYRWTDGSITLANGYQWYNGDGWGPDNIQLIHYRTTSMFWCNEWTQFLTADSDVSRRDITTSLFPNNRWYPLTFDHDGTLSRVDALFENQTLAGSGANWMGPLGLSAHNNRHARQSIGLAGNLATVIGLVAFSCQANELGPVLLNDRAWRHYDWMGHDRAHGREEGRGVVVATYLDPENTQGSTNGTLYPLEWERGPLLR